MSTRFGLFAARFSLFTPVFMLLVLGVLSPFSIPVAAVFIALPFLGLGFGVAALRRIKTEGPAGIRTPAVIGVAVNSLIVVLFAMNWHTWASRVG